MKTINISVTSLHFVDVPDEATISQIEEAVIREVTQSIDPSYVNDLEWHEYRNPNNCGSISI